MRPHPATSGHITPLILNFSPGGFTLSRSVEPKANLPSAVWVDGLDATFPLELSKNTGPSQGEYSDWLYSIVIDIYD